MTIIERNAIIGTLMFIKCEMEEREIFDYSQDLDQVCEWIERIQKGERLWKS